MIQLLLNRLQRMSGKTIVEFGAGYHEPFREEIARNNRYIVSDIHLEELSVQPDSRLDIRRLDACSIDLESASIDVACSSMLVMHLDMACHFSEVKRILKKDGVYLFAATGPRHNRELKVLGLDPHLDVDPAAMLRYGARLVGEKCNFVPFTNARDRLFWQMFVASEVDYAALALRGLTKHELLFELRPEEKYI